MNDPLQFRMDLEHLPAERPFRGTRSLGAFMMLFAVLWGGVPAAAIIAGLLKGNFEPSMAPALLFPLIGSGLFLFGLNQFTIRGQVRLTKSEVSFDRKTLFGHTLWTEPLARYDGLLSRTEHHSGGKNSPSYTLHLVELHHPEKKKRVVIYQSKSAEGFRQVWEDACRALDMPALEDGGQGGSRRNVADLDKTVRDLAKERKLDLRFDPRQAPPEGVQLEVGKDHLRIALPFPNLPLVIAAPWMLAGVVIAILPFVISDAPWIVVPMGLFILALPVFWRRSAGRTRQQLDISKSEVRVVWITPWGEMNPAVLPAGEIEQVENRGGAGRQAPALYLVTDRREVSAGHFLKPEAREWLRQCILAVITS